MEDTTIQKPTRRGFNEKVERNNQLFADWRDGMTYFQMRLKYNISENTIRSILLRYWAKYGRERRTDK